MRFHSKLLTALTICLALPAYAASENPMKGVWARGDGVARVRIEDCGQSVCAVNVWIKPGTKSEKVGDKLIMTLSSEGDGRFVGKANDPQRGLTYNLQVNVSDNSMTTRGCVLAKIICKSVSWTRIR